METWQSLVDDVDLTLHEFRYRFSKVVPPFRLRRPIGRKVLALPAIPFRGKAKPDTNQLFDGRDKPIVAFECPTDRGFLALSKAPITMTEAERKEIGRAHV